MHAQTESTYIIIARNHEYLEFGTVTVRVCGRLSMGCRLCQAMYKHCMFNVNENLNCIGLTLYYNYIGLAL